MIPPLQTATVAGATISYRDHGEGPVMVLIHGIGGSSRSWTPQFAAFAKEARLIAWDAPGYGGSQLSLPDQPTLDDYVRPLAGLVDELAPGAPALHLLGHSLGAPIAVRLAELMPSRVASLCLIHPVAGFGRLPPAAREEVRLGRLKDYDALGPAEFARQRTAGILAKKAAPQVIAEAMGIMAEIAPRAYRCAWQMMVAADIYQATGAIRAPTLVIAGAEDPVAPPAASREIAAAIAGARMTVVEEVGHYIMLEAPETFERLYRGFRGL